MDIDKVLKKVRNLLEKADSTEFPEERDSLLAGAEKIMLKYAIDEAELEKSRPAAERMVPESITIDIVPKGHHLLDQLTRLAMGFAAHYRCRIIFYGAIQGKNSFFNKTMANVVGFPSDLRFFELQFTNARLHIMSQIEPMADLGKSFDENVYILHDAGMSWRKIVYAMEYARRNGLISTNPDRVKDWPELPTLEEQEVRKSGGKCKTAYRRWCNQLGIETQKIQSPVNYQRQFATAYVHRVGMRLSAMKKQEGLTPGTALALRQEDVNSKFDELHPETKPIRSRVRERYDGQARARGHQAGSELDLGGTRVEGNRRALD